MMSTSDTIIIILSLLSLLFSLVAVVFAVIVTKEAQRRETEKRRIKAVKKARETSRLEVIYTDIEDQVESLLKKETGEIIQVKAKRRLQNTDTDTKIARL